MTSAEPGRKFAYSDNIRWHIVWQKIGTELPYRTIASNLNVSLGTVHNIYQRYVDTGTVTPKQQPCRQELRSLNQQDELFIIGIILDNPSVYLGEVCRAIEDVCSKNVSPATVFRVIHKHGINRKKLHQVAKQRSLVHSQAWYH